MLANVIIGFASSLSLVFGQVPEIPQHRLEWNQPITLDKNGAGVNLVFGHSAQLIAHESIAVPDAAWMRLKLKRTVILAGDRFDGGDFLKITSNLDGSVQYHDSISLKRWSHTSAYLNGDNVTMEIFTSFDANRTDLSARLEKQLVEEVVVGTFHSQNIFASSLCSNVDRRKLSQYKRTARYMPKGCTAWLIDDQFHCFLTANHCGVSPDAVLEFEVPPSHEDGTIRHPHPEFQFPIDVMSVQRSGRSVQGDDWLYGGAFPNSNTNLSPYETQQDCYYLSRNDTPPPDTTQMVQVPGYGTTSAPFRDRNQVQQTHVGPIVGARQPDPGRWSIDYAVDTTGGNSGSPVEHVQTGLAVGIHAYGGCTFDPSTGQSYRYNSGTYVGNPNLQRALKSPRGVCQYGYGKK